MYELCECKHFGGMSPNSSHVDRFQAGHGACTECDCKQFTWVKFCNSNGADYSDKELKIEINKIKIKNGVI
tara:strand:+ start:126 stop:338 length:213 start_codon:yes stop_codon:yes gene_type:complete